MGALNNIDVAILCGGLGTRLKQILNGNPKPMVDINGKGKPFLQFLVSKLQDAGFNRFIFLTGYNGEKIKTYFNDKGDYSFSHESSPLGTAGALKLAESHFVNKNILLLNGDSFCTINYHNFLDFHLSNSGLLSVGVVPAAKRGDGGFVSIDDNNRITSFVEKGISPSSFINAGIYFFKRDLLSRIPEKKVSSLEYDIFPTLDLGESFAYRFNERLFDIGTPERLEEFRLAFNGN